MAQSNEQPPAGVQDSRLFESDVRTTDPLTPKQQRAEFVVPDGFRISCFASEPQIQKPVNLAFDDDGRLWVTGSSEYPVPAADDQGRDSIRILEDTDNDGIADHVSVFAANLNIPIGLLPYGKGAIVFSIPDILYLEDTDDDGKADRTTKLYGPFDTSKDTHGMVNSLTAFHDGWIYACHGFNNQSTVGGSDGHEITMESGSTFRFRPDGSRIEKWTQGQVNPFGMTFDEFGDLYTSDCHSMPVNLLIRDGYHESFGHPSDGLGFIPNLMSHQHGSTAIDGVCRYDGNQFPADYRGDLMVGNVMTGRIHRNRIVRFGSTVTLEREEDFLVSKDPWFRPVDLECGPDGALYVADFYNRVIGHYEVALDHPGRDRERGRIWKIEYVGDDAKASDGTSATESTSAVGEVPASDLAPLRLSQLNTEQLIGFLSDERLQVRTRAANRLAGQPSDLSRPLIRNSFQEALADGSPAVGHLLWVMHRSGQLLDEDLDNVMDRGDTIAKIHAMKICGERKNSDQNMNQLKNGLRDSDFIVQRAAADAAGRHPSVSVFKELVNALTVCPGVDVHLRHGVRIAIRNQLRSADVVDWLLANDQPDAAYQACDEVLLGLHSEQTGRISLAILKSAVPKLARQVTLIEQGARHSSAEELDLLINFASRLEKLDGNQLTRIHAAFAEATWRNENADSPTFRAFERQLLARLMQGTSVIDLDWGRYQWDDRPSCSWALEERRKSTSRAGLFLSSLPGGEAGVGILRSKSFVVPFQLNLELCGHLGPLGQKAVSLNRVILRDIQTGSELRSHLPPRTDRAIAVNWKLSNALGKRTVIELHDGLDLKSYSWLALGSTVPAVVRVNRQGQADVQQRLATIAGILDRRSAAESFRQEELQFLADAVRANQVDGTSRQLAAEILFRRRNMEELVPLSEMLKFGRVPLGVQERIALASMQTAPWMKDQIELSKKTPTSSGLVFPIQRQDGSNRDDGNSDKEQQKDVDSKPSKASAVDRTEWMGKVVRSVFEELPEVYRTKLARKMASQKPSAPLLMDAIRSGVPSASVLRDATLVDILRTQGPPISTEVDGLLTTVVKEAAVSETYLAEVLQRVRDSTPEVEKAGQEKNGALFERHCAACHRQRSHGGLAGPQLVGIGTRGPNRLLEDIVYPHRNVDVAFRSTVVQLQSGKSVTGIVRPDRTRKQLIILKSDGQAESVEQHLVELQTETQQSLMPSGFHKLMSAEEMAGLIRWLMK